MSPPASAQPPQWTRSGPSALPLSNVATVDGLQDGSVDALIVQNPYAMGYLGVESAYHLLSGLESEVEKVVDTSTLTVDRENMFTVDGQKALFAFER